MRLALQQQRQTEAALIDSAGSELVDRALLALEENGYDPAIVERRRELLKRAEDITFREEQIEIAAADPARWISDWVWTFDPRQKPSARPFVLFPKQAEYLEWRSQRRAAREYGLIEKSRDAGLTWLNCCSNMHSWLFEPGYKGSIGSRKQDLVDRIGDMDSIFEKMRYILRYLPHWMRPAEDDYSDGFLKFINKTNGSSITGEAGDNMGRGGRSTVYDIDEAAFIERPMRVDAAVSENTDVVFYTSTPNGPGNVFAQKRHSGDIAVFSFHWKEDPRKNQWVLLDSNGAIAREGAGRDAPIGAIYPWYEEKKRKLDPVVLAQEIDIDYNASIEGVTIPHAWVLAAVELSLPPAGDRVGGLDVAGGGTDTNVLIFRSGPLVIEVEAWGEGNTTQTAYKARDLGAAWDLDCLNYDSVGIGFGVGGTLNSCDSLPFTIQGINGGESPTDKEWAGFSSRDDEPPIAKNIFLNLRAELWWSLRSRFERTYEQVNGLAEHRIDELISIPNHDLLISQLSQPLHSYNDRGKIVIESKASMKRRGVASPDYADALAYAFADPVRQIVRAGAYSGGSYERSPFSQPKDKRPKF